MTVTVEAYHGDLVDVRVLDPPPGRRLLCAQDRAGTAEERPGRAVRHRARQSRLLQRRRCATRSSPEKTPLGRILIEHNVLRRIEPTGFLRVVPGPALMEWFGLERAAADLRPAGLHPLRRQAGDGAAGDRGAGRAGVTVHGCGCRLMAASGPDGLQVHDMPFGPMWTDRGPMTSADIPRQPLPRGSGCGRASRPRHNADAHRSRRLVAKISGFSLTAGMWPADTWTVQGSPLVEGVNSP